MVELDFPLFSDNFQLNYEDYKYFYASTETIGLFRIIGQNY